jgi:hypothetical protein
MVHGIKGNIFQSEKQWKELLPDLKDTGQNHCKPLQIQWRKEGVRRSFVILSVVFIHLAFLNMILFNNEEGRSAKDFIIHFIFTGKIMSFFVFQ